MSDDFPRRRRLRAGGSPRRTPPNGNGPLNPWVVTIFAAIAVIVGGWFLGQALARVFNGPQKTQTAANAPTPLPVVTPVPSPTAPLVASATPTPRPRPTAQPNSPPTAHPTQPPSPQPTVQPSPTATVKVTMAPTPTPAPVPTTQPTREPTPVPTRRATPSPPATPLLSPASAVVRDYIEALRRGDPDAASAYLGNGSPDESFIDSATRIESVTSARNPDGSYKVVVRMQTSQGEYDETFTVASDRILEKSAVKP